MNDKELETIIIINNEDKKQGYFSFGTAKANDYKKLLKKIGGVEFLREKPKLTFQGTKITWFQCKVPIIFLSPSFGIRKRKNKADLSEEQKQALKERGQRLKNYRAK